jgi:hypothetical protein
MLFNIIKLRNLGRRQTEAYDLNDSGQSVGAVGPVEGRRTAVLWSPSGKATVLEHGGGGDNYAVAINEAGWSVGQSVTTQVHRSGSGASGSFISDAMLWSPSGKGTVLKDVGGYGVSYANERSAQGL